MNGQFQELVLGTEGTQYLKACLAEGHTFAGYLLKKLERHQGGRITTHLPKGTDAEKVKDFHRGGVLPPRPSSEWRTAQAEGKKLRMAPIPDAMPRLAALVKDFLSLGSQRVCVVENALARPTDPALSRISAATLTHQDEVYHVIRGPRAERQQIADTLRLARSIPDLIVALAIVPSSLLFRLQNGAELSANDLEILAEGVEKIAVGAYDGEGYVIWTSL